MILFHSNIFLKVVGESIRAPSAFLVAQLICGYDIVTEWNCDLHYCRILKRNHICSWTIYQLTRDHQPNKIIIKTVFYCFRRLLILEWRKGTALHYHAYWSQTFFSHKGSLKSQRSPGNSHSHWFLPPSIPRSQYMRSAVTFRTGYIWFEMGEKYQWCLLELLLWLFL